MKRIVRILAVAVLVATMLVIASTPTVARPKFGGVQVSSRVCHTPANDVATKAGEFHWQDPIIQTVCWHTSPGLLQDS